MEDDFSHPPKRIISLVPSQTELLFELGLNEEVVGITKFCIHPAEWFQSKTRVGGTKTVNIEKIKSLKPDLILANKEENTKEDIEQLMEVAPVWMSDIFNLEDALQMIRTIGKLTGKIEKSEEIVKQIQFNFNQLEVLPSSHLKKCAYFIWRDPYMIAGKNTFIDDMLKYCGFVNCSIEERYPEWNELPEEAPEVILLSSEPYPFQQKHIEELQLKHPQSFIKLVDGELFSWYGSRLLKSAAYFSKLKQEIISATEE